MLKFLLMFGFSIPLVFVSGSWWLVQNLFFSSCFVYLISCYNFGFWGHLGYFFGMDLLSSSLILLSIWICSLMIMASESIIKSNYNSIFFLFLILLLLLFLYNTFMSLDLLFFYISFEASIIPTLLLILGWGYQPERLQAGVYLLFYTLFASLPLLVGMMHMYKVFGSVVFLLMDIKHNFMFIYSFLYMVMVFAFLVKMPMYLVHLWLPKAHVEAPVSGSMILAGVLLKLGGYGLLRVFPVMLILCSLFNFIWIILSLVGGVFISLVCLRQSDLKALIAYSSVAHMGIVLAGMMNLSYWGLSGCLVLMIGHGLCSSGLFAMANICYERLGSRSLLVNKGLLSFMPSMAFWWFLLSSSNMAAPPSLNLVGEINLMNSIVSWSGASMYGLALISFLSAGYTLYMYSSTQHGYWFSGTFSCFCGSSREYLVMFLHWFPLNYLILKVGPLFYLI
uniref:NADH-ubiquinone oxidoreductase chain 4 n=1 Tax=Petrobiellus sp. 2 JZ-2014 TaxID=1529459 RepID=A0A0B4N577_9INSE|nr:NADH dehydrogenase subunit 4 [Petrobiellus sp. 2 JZ-2014]